MVSNGTGRTFLEKGKNGKANEGIVRRFSARIEMSDTNEERIRRDEQIRDTIMAKLVETGEKDRLKDLIRSRLISCGWRDELKEYCKDVIRRKGLEKVTVEELVAEITPKGRSTIPEDVKAELLQRIRKFLQAA